MLKKAGTWVRMTKLEPSENCPQDDREWDRLPWRPSHSLASNLAFCLAPYPFPALTLHKHTQRWHWFQFRLTASGSAYGGRGVWEVEPAREGRLWCASVKLHIGNSLLNGATNSPNSISKTSWDDFTNRAIFRCLRQGISTNALCGETLKWSNMMYTGGNKGYLTILLLD